MELAKPSKARYMGARISAGVLAIVYLVFPIIEVYTYATGRELGLDGQPIWVIRLSLFLVGAVPFAAYAFMVVGKSGSLLSLSRYAVLLISALLGLTALSVRDTGVPPGTENTSTTFTVLMTFAGYVLIVGPPMWCVVRPQILRK